MRHLPDRLLYGAWRLASMLLRSLPPRAAQSLGACVGRAWWRLDRRHRTRAHENLRACLGEERSALERRRLSRASFESMARVAVDTLWFERLLGTPAQLHRRCRLLGDWPGFRQATEAERPGLLLSAHLGAWEVAPYLMATRPAAFASVARPIDNPLIDADVRKRRGKVFPHRSAARPLRAALGRGEWVGLALDQNAGNRGRYSPFFGMQASTARAPIAFALRAEAPIWLGIALRTRRPLAYDIHLERLRIPASTAPGARVDAYLAAYHRRLEHFIRLAPEQYNWMHRRWKDRPRGEAPDPRLPVYDHHR